jgi:exosome complex component RRP43
MQDVYCLDADGSLLDTALLASVAALAHLQLPAVSVSEEGRVYPVSSTMSGDVSIEGAETSIKVKGNSISPRRRLKLGAAPFALTCMVHKKHLLADPCAEEETLLQCSITITMNQMGRLVSFYKPGGAVPATTAIVKECISLARRRAREVEQILKEALEDHIESPSLMQTD